jgi:hypothetical protein
VKKLHIINLKFEANHGVTEENIYCNPGAYYSWSVCDKDGNVKYEKEGTVLRETLFGNSIAQSGDWIFIYIGVYDVFDYGSVTCKSDDGTIDLIAYSNNLYIDDSDDMTLKSLQYKDTTIKIQTIKYQLK